MEIKVSTENGRVPVTFVHVDGNIDANTSDMFQAKADELIKDGARFSCALRQQRRLALVPHHLQQASLSESRLQP